MRKAAPDVVWHGAGWSAKGSGGACRVSYTAAWCTAANYNHNIRKRWDHARDTRAGKLSPTKSDYNSRRLVPARYYGVGRRGTRSNKQGLVYGQSAPCSAPPWSGTTPPGLSEAGPTRNKERSWMLLLKKHRMREGIQTVRWWG
jgi:hypothetical protein